MCVGMQLWYIFDVRECYVEVRVGYFFIVDFGGLNVDYQVGVEKYFFLMSYFIGLSEDF